MKMLILLFFVTSCGEYHIGLVNDGQQCLDVKTIDTVSCELKTKTYQCSGKGEFTLDMKTVSK